MRPENPAFKPSKKWPKVLVDPSDQNTFYMIGGINLKDSQASQQLL
jgi:hypothetical protein